MALGKLRSALFITYLGNKSCNKLRWDLKIACGTEHHRVDEGCFGTVNLWHGKSSNIRFSVTACSHWQIKGHSLAAFQALWCRTRAKGQIQTCGDEYPFNAACLSTLSAPCPFHSKHSAPSWDCASPNIHEVLTCLKCSHLVSALFT